MDGEILEGFLCPVCKEDLKSPERLTNHVEQQHAEEQIILKSLKEIFGFARKKILNSEESTNLSKALLDSSLSLKSNIFVMSKIDTPSEDIIQEIGGECDHIAYFKAVRNPRLERYATETNKLVIRLHKLLRDRPRDPIQRKMHEQERVPWLDGKDVDNTSKSILTIPAPQGSRSDALKKALRLACVTYIKEELLSLPQLPLEDEIDRLQRKRCEETEMRIEQEREMATQALERYEQSRNFSSGTTTPCAPCAVKGSAVASLDNWSVTKLAFDWPSANFKEQHQGATALNPLNQTYSTAVISN
uniref:Uncharacterized protein n=1 Tax=Phlebotomus papatasi TaxID=29031 RepID=A0A1B0D3J4_PHLPP